MNFSQKECAAASLFAARMIRTKSPNVNPFAKASDSSSALSAGLTHGDRPWPACSGPRPGANSDGANRNSG